MKHLRMTVFALLMPWALACSPSSQTAAASPTEGSPTAEPALVTLAGQTIDHSNYRAIEAASPSVLAEIKKQKIFFAHASVGQNIVDGLRALHASDPNRYPLIVEGAGDRAPATTKPGTFYEFGRGNPGADAKIDSFVQYANQGWAKPGVDVIANKFCYIDPDANFDKYTRSMTQIEKDHPGTLVVYMTIPVCAGDDATNDQREAFNDKLRAWSKSGKRALLDIADIEAYSPNGQANLSRTGARLLYKGYTDDGGHLNATGAKAVAQGFYSLLATRL